MDDPAADRLVIAKDQAIMWTAASLYTGGADTVCLGLISSFAHSRHTACPQSRERSAIAG